MQKNHEIKLRSVREEDAELLWRWVNDQAVRQASFNTEKISWEEHKEWLETRLDENRTRIYVAENDSNDPIGQIRFEWAGDATAVVNVSVKKSCRGQGWGTELISQGSNRYFEDVSTCDKLIALIKKENKKSIKAFQNADYSFQSHEKIKGCEAIKLIYAKNNDR